MAKANNKEALQSYVLTAAKYDFNVYEKRVLYCLVEMAQCEVEGLQFPKDCRKIDHDLFGFVNVSIPCSRILRSEEDKNHKRVKDALLALTKKVIEYEDDKQWIALNIIAFPKIKKYEDTFSFTIHPMIWDCILNFSKGYRKIELATVKDFISEYSMRFYELMSGQERPLTYLIDDLKTMFKLDNKYKNVNDFLKKVIETAKKELDEKSPYSFEYKINKQGKKFHSITFYPTFKPEHRDEVLEARELQKQVSLQWDLTRETVKYLKEVYLFDEKEIKQHIELFKEANNKFDLLIFLAEKRRYAETAKNPKGYIISCIKKAVKDFKEEKNNIEAKAIPKVPTAEDKTPADLFGGLAKNLSVNK